MSKRRQTKPLPPIETGFRIYTDGSAYTQTREGGWGVYVASPDGDDTFFKGRASDTTISRMEMYAMQRAIELIVEGNLYPANIYSDSAMVVNSINKGWLNSWVREKFVGRINSDIWEKINDGLSNCKPIGIHHINGHLKNTDHPHVFGNSVADILADYKS